MSSQKGDFPQIFFHLISRKILNLQDLQGSENLAGLHYPNN